MTGTTVVITSIHSPTPAMRSMARGCREHGYDLIVAGDVQGPADFGVDGARLLSVSDQLASGFAFAKVCPLGHYARKNVGYLEAIRSGGEWIVDTDDDNAPHPAFFSPRTRQHRVKRLSAGGWVNVYAYFTSARAWPRGLPLPGVQEPVPDFASLPTLDCDCPIQQGLTDGNPDVDAIYRMILPLPLTFRRDRRLALARATWCPFNSQNTTWHRDVFPLLYLPVTCSFRLTDVWRSFVAQRIAHVNDWSILFHEPTTLHDRNPHDLMVDFAGEVPGYLHNARIAAALERLSLVPGRMHLGHNLRTCYARMIELELLAAQELALLDAWLLDLEALGVPCA